MSTHAGIIFNDIAIYRHSDGHPERTGEDLVEFMYQCSLLKDSRLNDPAYLSAKYVVWLAHQYIKYFSWPLKNLEKENYENPQEYLNFLNIGIISVEEAMDKCDYIYHIDFENKSGYPIISCFFGHKKIKTYDIKKIIAERDNKKIKDKVV